MQLSYRGATYEVSVPVETMETEIHGKYRGTVVTFRQAPRVSSSPSTVIMKYRGVPHLDR